MAFQYYSPISINAAQVPTTQTDFPVLVSVTDARFKTVGNGGHVQNASGFDIRPYTDSTLSTAITGYELEFYDGVNGILVMWVKVSSLSSSTTPFVLAYGDASLTTDGSSTTTWSNSFDAVYHLKDGTTLSVANSTSSTAIGSNNGVTAATGQIDGCGGFVSASSQYIALSGIGFNNAALTASAWVKGTTFPNDYNGVVTKGSAGSDNWAFFVKSNGKIYAVVSRSGGSSSYDGTGSHTLSTGTWYYLTITYDSSSGLIGYVNAASDGTSAANGSASATSIDVDIGRQRSTSSRYFNGSIDEVRYCSVARSPDWVTTEYNNQLAPGTFETLGTEASVTPILGIYTA